MTPFETAYAEVAGLVREFEANEDHYLSPKYQEAEVREASRESERDQLTRKCEYLDNEIDKLVYELYGVSEEEIKIVEAK
jgi:hypothetical protein